MHRQDPTDPTGVKDLNPRGSSVTANARLRKGRAAIELRKSGASWDEIAQVLGFPSGHLCLVATEKALEKDLRSEESRDFMREMAGQRLDRLLRGVWSKAIDPDHPEQMVAVDRARMLIDRHIKLYGLDAPTEMVIRDPNQVELEKWVSEVMKAKAPELTEADIFEPDVIEGEVHSVKSEADDAVQVD